MSLIRVAVISPYVLVQAVWGSFLRECRYFQVVGGFTDVKSFLAFGSDNVDAVLVSLREKIPASSLQKIPASTRVVLFGQRSKTLAKRILVVDETDSPGDLISRLAGGQPLAPLSCLVRDGADGGNGRKLSPKEMQVLAAICRGESLKEIAHAEGHTVSTVDTRIKRIKQKLGAKSRADMILHAAARGLITCPCGLGRPGKSE